MLVLEVSSKVNWPGSAVALQLAKFHYSRKLWWTSEGMLKKNLYFRDPTGITTLSKMLPQVQQVSLTCATFRLRHPPPSGTRLTPRYAELLVPHRNHAYLNRSSSFRAEQTHCPLLFMIHRTSQRPVLYDNHKNRVGWFPWSATLIYRWSMASVNN